MRPIFGASNYSAVPHRRTGGGTAPGRCKEPARQMTTTVISKVETKTAPTAYAGGDFLIIRTGGVTDTNGAAAQAHMAQVGTDVVITLDAGDTIVLLHQTLAHLVAHDFAFT